MTDLEIINEETKWLSENIQIPGVYPTAYAKIQIAATRMSERIAELEMGNERLQEILARLMGTKPENIVSDNGPKDKYYTYQNQVRCNQCGNFIVMAMTTIKENEIIQNYEAEVNRLKAELAKLKEEKIQTDFDFIAFTAKQTGIEMFQREEIAKLKAELAAVKPITCGECGNVLPSKFCFYDSNEENGEVNPDDFCSRAVRKEE